MMDELIPAPWAREGQDPAALPRTIRRVLHLATEAGRDPWETAAQAGRLHDQRAALIWANALRWQVAHDFRRMGRPDLARAVMAELTVDCTAIEGGAADAR